MDSIKEVFLTEVTQDDFKACLGDCLIINGQGKLFLQKRPDNWNSAAGKITLFGGHVESEETPYQGMVREIHEETGAKIEEGEAVFVGAITEAETNHTEIVHLYFWEDKESRITGCYEADYVEFENAEAALNSPELMDYAAWTLKKCMALGLIR